MTTQQLEELRNKLAELHNYNSQRAVESKSDFQAFYSGRADAFLYTIHQLNLILKGEKVGA